MAPTYTSVVYMYLYVCVYIIERERERDEFTYAGIHIYAYVNICGKRILTVLVLWSLVVGQGRNYHEPQNPNDTSHGAWDWRP